MYKSKEPRIPPVLEHIFRKTNKLEGQYCETDTLNWTQSYKAQVIHQPRNSTYGWLGTEPGVYLFSPAVVGRWAKGGWDR